MPSPLPSSPSGLRHLLQSKRLVSGIGHLDTSFLRRGGREILMKRRTGRQTQEIDLEHSPPSSSLLEICTSDLFVAPGGRLVAQECRASPPRPPHRRSSFLMAASGSSPGDEAARVCLDILRGASQLAQPYAAQLSMLLKEEGREHELALVEALVSCLGEVVAVARGRVVSIRDGCMHAGHLACARMSHTSIGESI
jgi:hypothetical protein